MRPIRFRAWAMNKPNEYAMWDWDTYRTRIGEWIGNEESKVKLMQFTGLLDRNGKEIYESDLFKTHHEQTYEIVYYKNGFYLKDGIYSQIDYEKGEVIGNIYESPDLLK